MVGFLTKALCKIHQFTAMISFTRIPSPNVKTFGKASLQKSNKLQNGFFKFNNIFKDCQVKRPFIARFDPLND